MRDGEKTCPSEASFLFIGDTVRHRVPSRWPRPSAARWRRQPAGGFGSRVDPPGHKDATSCLFFSGVDLDELFRVSRS